MGAVDQLLSCGSETSLNSKLGQWRMGVATFIDAYPTYLTQTDWNVDSVNGNDANSGITGSPLRTLAELCRRWFGRTFAPTVTAVSINLSGSFQTESLNLKTLFTSVSTSPTIVTIKGTLSQLTSGTITAYASWNSAGNIRSSLTDTSQDFTSHVRRRIRITSGVANGAIAGIGSLGGGSTIANVGQFRTGPGVGGFNGANVNPAVNDRYVIEKFNTQVLGYSIDCPGARVILQDIEFFAPNSGTISAWCFSRQNTQSNMMVFGCRYLNTGFNAGLAVTIGGDHTMISCMHESYQEFRNGSFLIKSQCVFGSMKVYDSKIDRDSSMHDGNGTDTGDLGIVRGAQIREFTFAAFFGCVDNSIQQALVRVSAFSAWNLEDAYFWGAAGNLKTNALWVGNGSGVIYGAIAVPKATGATPGVNDVVVSNVGSAWAALPILAAAPNNGFVNVNFH